MKLINFKCNDCVYEQEELFNDMDNIPYRLETFCPMCGGLLEKFNFKNNSQRVYVNDPQR